MRMSRVLMVVAIAVTLSLVFGVGKAGATPYTYNAPSALTNLENSKAYLWGIQPNIPSNEVITGATITLNSIYDASGGADHLYITLLGSAAVGVTSYTDNDAAGNYFASSGTEIKMYQNLPWWYSQTLSYTLTSAQIDTLKTYAADNNFGIGLDPDCHYCNSGVSFSICTQPKPQEVLGSLGDRVWLDANVNGIQDSGEIGIDGVTVKLLDASQNVLSTDVTAAGGYYLFDQLSAGSYFVQFTSPAGYLFTLANIGSDAADSDANPATGLTSLITLASGANDLTNDAGLYQPGAPVPEPASLVLLGLLGLGFARRVRK